jgi:cation transport regulator ChaC
MFDALCYNRTVLDVLSNAIEELRTIDVYELDDAMLCTSVVEIQRDIDRLSAMQAKLLALWDSRRCWVDDGSRTAAHRYARETGLSISDAKRLTRRARHLTHTPVVSTNFANGELSVSQTELLVRTRQANVADEFARDEAFLTQTVQTLPFVDAARALKYWLQRADEQGCADKGQRQLHARSAHASRTFEDTVDLHALFDPVGGEIFLNEFERIERMLFEHDWAEAKAIHGDGLTINRLGRTPQQRRCDALVALAKRSASMPAGNKPPVPLLNVLVGYETFANICELASGTVITPGLVVPLLQDADIERVVFDSPSRVIDVGNKRRFGGALRRAIQIRDRHCQHPSGCDVPARDCQIDHVEAFVKTQRTSQSNGQLLCPKHNRAKGSGPPLAGDGSVYNALCSRSRSAGAEGGFEVVEE